MPSQIPTVPVEDSVPKVDGGIAVGENLDFHRKWWKFERAIWIFFLMILIADALGAFGRGWLSNSTKSAAAQTLTFDYERIERASTPVHHDTALWHEGHSEWTHSALCLGLCCKASWSTAHLASAVSFRHRR
jgi:hypothetical protein